MSTSELKKKKKPNENDPVCLFGIILWGTCNNYRSLEKLVFGNLRFQWVSLNRNKKEMDMRAFDEQCTRLGSSHSIFCLTYVGQRARCITVT